MGNMDDHLPNEQLRHDRMRVCSDFLFFWLMRSQSQGFHTKQASADGAQARNSLWNTETWMQYMTGAQEQETLSIVGAV